MLSRITTVLAVGVLCVACGDDSANGNDNRTDAHVDGGNSGQICGNGTIEGAEECDDGANNSDSTPDACRTNCESAGCGDGVTDTGEECDDGPANADTVPNVCRSGCTNPTCGDGVVDADWGEGCDDGNNVDGDGCQSDCTLPDCGDGVMDPDEACDDGNLVSGDGCNRFCTSDETCGNGITDTAAGEECDDGNNDDADGCQGDCFIPVCGDGVKDASEICDDGNTNDGDGCSAHCHSDETCGNGIVDVATGEACDDGNNVDADGCSNNCSLPGCGDGIKAGHEACDDGNNENGDPTTPSTVGCNAWCTSDETCQNGVIDPHMGEECDDGNAVGGDGCSPSCTVEVCGNHITDTNEVCDDGNLVSGDGCSSDCLSTEWCGNGITDVAAGELCDDGNSNPNDGCHNCTLPSCGDGLKQNGEECDDGDNLNGTPGHPGCNAWCSSDETCGNGVVDAHMGEECDAGDNDDGDADGCQADCTIAVCGDGIQDPHEACDDGDNVDGQPGDPEPRCNATCTSNETCGNLVLDAHMGEACDDGNANDNDGCHNDCTLPSCGDGVLDPGEVCDDGNNQNGHPGDPEPRCNALCNSDETCGNGVLDSHMGEGCDDANSVDTDGCHNDCSLPSCGDGVLDPGEVCDDGDNVDGQPGDPEPRCNATCTSNETCGNGFVDTQMGEQCDDGNSVQTDGCHNDCTLPSCGDSILDPGEACDLGDTDNGAPGDPLPRCNQWCTSTEVCGNGVLDGHMGELCDLGAANSDAPDAVCRTDCTPGRCGDGIQDSAEACDDGNNDPCDGCAPDCSRVDNDCGDGIPECGEACDLGGGNSDDPDATCRTDCTPQRCGDGVVDVNAGEECDTTQLPTNKCSNIASPNPNQNYYSGTLTCLPNCKYDISDCSGFCGDAIRNGAEKCDGADLNGATCLGEFGRYVGTPGCNATCTAFELGSCDQWCGDGIKNGPEACDKTSTTSDFGTFTCANFGYYGGDLDCSADCMTIETQPGCSGYCGDGVRNGSEQCDGADHDGLTCSSYFSYTAQALNCDANCSLRGEMCFGPGFHEVHDPDLLGASAIWAYDRYNIFAISSTKVLHYDGLWTSIDNPTSPAYLVDVHGTSPTNVWAVGTSGSIIHYDGTGWSTVSNPSTGNLRDVWVVDSHTVWVAGYDGEVLRTTNGGASWSRWVLTGGAYNFYAVFATSSTQALVTGQDNKTWRYDAGSWSEVTDKPSTGTWDFNDLWGTSIYNVHGVGGSGLSWRYNGSKWNAVPDDTSSTLNAVWGASSNDIYAAGYSGALLHYDGTEWVTLDSGTTETLYGVAGAAAGDLWLVGHDSIWMHQDGSDWAEYPVPSGGSGSKEDIRVTATGGAYFVGTDWSGGMILYCDAGECTVHTIPASAEWMRGIWGASDSDMWVVGDAGTIVHRETRQVGTFWITEWVDRSGITTQNLNDVWGAGSYVYAVGDNGTVVRQTGAPTNWVHYIGIPSSKHFRAIWGTSSSDYWIVGDDGLILHWTGSWHKVSDSGPNWRAVWGTSPTDVWVVGNNGNVRRWDGVSWNVVDAGFVSGDYLRAVGGNGPDDVWVGGDDKVRHFDGNRWTAVQIPLNTSSHVAAIGIRDSHIWLAAPAIFELEAHMPQITGGLCTRSIPIYCGQTLRGNNATMPDRFDDYGACGTGHTAAETIYRLQNPVTGDITVSLTPTVSANNLNLFVIDGVDDQCDPTSCEGSSVLSGSSTDEVTFAATSGSSYFFVVDGLSSNKGAFTLQVECTKVD